MKQLIEYIVSNLVNHPEDVLIEESKGADSEDISITIQVNPEDTGRVIGRSGKVIKAIRQIARIAAIQKGLRVRVDLKDDNRQAPETPDTESEMEAAPKKTSKKTKLEPVPELELSSEDEPKTSDEE